MKPDLRLPHYVVPSPRKPRRWSRHNIETLALAFIAVLGISAIVLIQWRWA